MSPVATPTLRPCSASMRPTSFFNPQIKNSNKPPTVAMAAFTLDFTPVSRDFGRSGYNKDDEETKGNKGRSGYNKSDDDDAGKNKGRSGYNKGDEEGSSKDKGRSGYN
ncbi:hypothetical protein HJFPF1_11488 [Paramyrothecium foliicola]|nr:hypothetical protein HJFPF1_11488 [Paramyrothecium foliicola]